MRRPALLSQVLTVNTLVIVATVFAASVAARLDLGNSTGLRQFLVLAAAILATILANNFVMRRRFAPLESLTRTMECVDLTAPGIRAQASAGEPADIARLRESFNLMISRLEAERKGTAVAVLRAQESERARVARDLHDEVNQALAAVSIRLAATAEGAPPQFAEELAETQRLATQAMQELLGLARDLRPAALDDHGLLPALRTQVRVFGERFGIPAQFSADGTRLFLGEFEQLVVYRVVQEALSNAARHAHAQTLRVAVSGCNGAQVRVTVVDDGSGFDPGRLRDGGSGLAGMRERAMLAGGRLDVRTVPGAGTTIELVLDAKGTRAR
ncbi:MAG: two-component system, NarL family, sensor histidine kinase UhpB [Solirubrobacteraceae bacterium]|jgi:two-component system sensor histidine kinase UhpB|nr:two-component system, NarL family, sensor histidine kinase UhpB [Solirubrobacteraceae bacterium]